MTALSDMRDLVAAKLGSVKNLSVYELTPWLDPDQGETVSVGVMLDVTDSGGYNSTLKYATLTLAVVAVTVPAGNALRQAAYDGLHEQGGSQGDITVVDLTHVSESGGVDEDLVYRMSIIFDVIFSGG